ncbi:hypothetical protein Tco_0078467 [Tanacetum coccineum]
MNFSMIENLTSYLYVFGALCYPTNEEKTLYLNPPPCVYLQVPAVIAPEPAVLTGSPSSTTIDQYAPSTSTSQTNKETPSPVIPLAVIPNDVEEDNHDLDVAHMNNDPFFGILILENNAKASSSSDVIPTIMHTAAPNSEYITK